MRKRIFVLAFLCGMCIDTMHAQIPPAGRPGLGETVVRSGDFDSTVVYVTPGNIYQVDTLTADSLNALSHQYDPIRHHPMQYAHLGNLGSAHRRQRYDLYHSKGLDLGQNQYRLYQRLFDTFRFYDTQTALTEFNYSQGLDQLDGVLHATFGRTFAGGVKASIDYLRINQEGVFTHQRGKHTAFGFGMWFDAPDGRYDGLYHYGSNGIVQQDNGGITDYVQLMVQQLTVNVPVHLTDALTTHRQRGLSVQNHFHLNPPNDSVQRTTFFDIIHTGKYQSGFVRFSDENIQNDLDYYRDFVVDSRGVRHFMDLQTLDNSLDLQVRVAAGNERHHSLRAGLQYRSSKLGQEPEERTLNETFLNAEGRLWLTPKLHLDGAGYIALTGQSGDFRLNGHVGYSLTDADRLSAELTLYSRSPNVIERKLYVAQIPVWETDMQDLTHTRLDLAADVQSRNLVIRGTLHLLSQAVYFDTLRRPAQLEGTHQILQLQIGKEIRIGHLGLDAGFILQNAPSELAVPNWIANGQLFYSGRWFKNKLLVRTGLDLRMTDGQRGINYFPLTGQFHHDDSRRIELYPAVDLFFDMQVKQSFRAFFKIENASAYLIDDPFLQVVDYPQFEAYFRFGLWMKLFD